MNVTDLRKAACYLIVLVSICVLCWGVITLKKADRVGTKDVTAEQYVTEMLTR